MKSLTLTCIAAVLTLSASLSYAGDAAAGKAKTAVCAGCHGAEGISNNGMWPNLAGQKEAYLVKAINDYKNGKRNDPMMASMVKGLSDADIANLAAYYSSL